jgi:hypothetical protein
MCVFRLAAKLWLRRPQQRAVPTITLNCLCAIFCQMDFKKLYLGKYARLCDDGSLTAQNDTTKWRRP